MKKAIYVIIVLIILIAGYYGWLYYKANELVSGLDLNTDLAYKTDLVKYNQAINADDIVFCESINTSAVFDNGENIKTRCEDSIYFNLGFKNKDNAYCRKMSASSPMRQNCFEMSVKK